MVIKNIQAVIRQKLSATNPVSPNDLQFFSVGGGSINETYRLGYGESQYFCKINSATKFPRLFEKEKKGLELISQQGIIKTPGIIDCFETGNHQVLLMKWVSTGDRNPEFWKKFGEQLARLHAMTQEQFGWCEDNYMGSIPQSNTREESWVSFFIQHRLQPMVDQCRQKNLLSSKHLNLFGKLYDGLPGVFSEVQKPALVHGDLWNGNFMCNENSEPVLIDPAAFYGHPSVDLGMTTLFGGFSPGFYEAYNYHSPFPKNHKQQWQICNLYPLLIHLFLFGKGYLAQVEFSLHQSLNE